MTARRRRTQKLASRIGNTDLRDDFTPISCSPWVEAALAGPGANLEDIAKSVADAAVFAAMEAIAEQGVKGRPEFWEIDALHRLITDIVVQRLLDASNRGQATMASVVVDLIADARDAEHESGGRYDTRLMLADKDAPR